MDRFPLLIIQGATATGKSRFALDLAGKLQTDIISADSRQVYKYMNIGTAKPSKIEREQIEHHLIDIVTPDVNYNAGDFVKDTEQIISELVSNEKLPMVVGGTGFYIKALLEGLFDAPLVPQEIRAELIRAGEEKGSQFLHDELKKVDPASAKRADPKDMNRIIRALEIYRVTGKPITRLWKEKAPRKPNYEIFNILLYRSRDVLYKIINQRVDNMMKNGLLTEVQALLQKGYKETDPGLNTVGYKEFFPYLKHEKDLDSCVEKIKKNTRNFAKRQFTWYRKIEFDLTLEANDINISEVYDIIKNKFGEQSL